MKHMILLLTFLASFDISIGQTNTPNIQKYPTSFYNDVRVTDSIWGNWLRSPKVYFLNDSTFVTQGATTGYVLTCLDNNGLWGWRPSGGGGAQGLQDVITVNPNLTQDNIINAQSHNLTIDSVQTYFMNGVNGSYFQFDDAGGLVEIGNPFQTSITGIGSLGPWFLVNPTAGIVQLGDISSTINGTQINIEDQNSKIIIGTTGATNVEFQGDTIKFGHNAGAGKVLTSDAIGNAFWAASSGTIQKYDPSHFLFIGEDSLPHVANATQYDSLEGAIQFLTPSATTYSHYINGVGFSQIDVYSKTTSIYSKIKIDTASVFLEHMNTTGDTLKNIGVDDVGVFITPTGSTGDKYYLPSFEGDTGTAGQVITKNADNTSSWKTVSGGGALPLGEIGYGTGSGITSDPNLYATSAGFGLVRYYLGGNGYVTIQADTAAGLLMQQTDNDLIQSSQFGIGNTGTVLRYTDPTIGAGIIEDVTGLKLTVSNQSTDTSIQIWIKKDSVIIEHTENGIASCHYALPQTNGTDGQVLTTNGAGSTSWQNASISGVYLPDTSDNIGITDFSIDSAAYSQVGNVVTVTGYISNVSSLGIGPQSIEISLPVPSNIARAGQLTGCISLFNSGTYVIGNATTDKAIFKLGDSATLTNNQATFTFLYLVY